MNTVHIKNIQLANKIKEIYYQNINGCHWQLGDKAESKVVKKNVFLYSNNTMSLTIVPQFIPIQNVQNKST